MNAPKIVVLDGYTLTPHGTDAADTDEALDWSALEKLGSLTVYSRTPAEDVAARAAGASVVLTNKAVLDKEAIRSLDALRYIGVLATGTNVVDLNAAKAAGVVVTNVPAYSSASVAQHVFALILSLTNKVAEHNAAVAHGDWAGCDDFSFRLGQLTELQDKTLGVVGAGDIGRRVLRIGEALGMKLKVYSRTQRDLGMQIHWVGLDELFETADVVSLHCPLTPETERMVDADRLKSIKRNAILINTGRGPLIDEPALAEALKIGLLAGAGLDVLGSEPPAADNPLIGLDRCVITPHNAWATAEARQRLMDTAVSNIEAFLAGEPINVVNA